MAFGPEPARFDSFGIRLEAWTGADEPMWWLSPPSWAVRKHLAVNISFWLICTILLPLGASALKHSVRFVFTRRCLRCGKAITAKNAQSCTACGVAFPNTPYGRATKLAQDFAYSLGLIAFVATIGIWGWSHAETHLFRIGWQLTDRKATTLRLTPQQCEVVLSAETTNFSSGDAKNDEQM